MINHFTSVIFNKICLYVPMGLKNLAFHYGYSHSLCANAMIFTPSVSSFIEISNYIYFRGKYYQLLDKAHSSQENPTIGLTLCLLTPIDWFGQQFPLYSLTYRLKQLFPLLLPLFSTAHLILFPPKWVRVGARPAKYSWMPLPTKTSDWYYWCGIKMLVVLEGHE